jgi:exosortase
MTSVRSVLAAPVERLSPIAMIYGVLFLSALTLWPSVYSLARFWHDVPDYNHGMLLAPVIAVWPFFLRRELAAYTPAPQPWALPFLAAALFVWVVAFRGNSELGQQLLLPPVLWLAVCVVCGHALALRVAAPLAWLYFAIPIWEYLVPLLQLMTVAVTEAILKLLDIPAVIDGFRVTLPSGSFHVAEGCSGRRYFVVTLTVASLGGVIARLPPRRLMLLIASAIAMALVANWVRVLLIVLAGHVTHMQHYWVTVEHNSLGWIIFALLVVAIGLLVHRLSSPVLATPPVREVSSARASADVGVWKVAAPAAVILLLLATHVLRSLDGAPASNARLGDWPVLASQWQGPLPANAAWVPHYVGPSQEARAAYRSGSTTIEVYVNLYAQQAPGAELIFYQNTLEPPAGARWIVESEYRIGGLVTARDPVAQLLYGVRSLTRPVPSGVLAFAVRCDDGDCDAASHALADFKNHYGRALLTLIPTH